jgi:GTPase SAR1 family protein
MILIYILYAGRADRWHKEITTYASPSTVVVVVGTKVDLTEQRTIPYEECLRFASERQLPYFEVSSKTGLGVARMLRFAATRRLRREMSAPAAAAAAVAAPADESKKTSSRCVLS